MVYLQRWRSRAIMKESLVNLRKLFLITKGNYPRSCRSISGEVIETVEKNNPCGLLDLRWMLLVVNMACNHITYLLNILVIHNGVGIGLHVGESSILRVCMQLISGWAYEQMEKLVFALNWCHIMEAHAGTTCSHFSEDQPTSVPLSDCEWLLKKTLATGHQHLLMGTVVFLSGEPGSWDFCGEDRCIA